MVGQTEFDLFAREHLSQQVARTVFAYDGVMRHHVDDLSLGAAPRQVRDDQLLLIVVWS